MASCPNTSLATGLGARGASSHIDSTSRHVSAQQTMGKTGSGADRAKREDGNDDVGLGSHGCLWTQLVSACASALRHYFSITETRDIPGGGSRL